MRREHVSAAHQGDPQAPGARPTRGRAVLVLLVGLALAPVAYEGASVAAVRWMSLHGPHRHVETPVLNALSRGASETYNGVVRTATRPLRYLPWKPLWVVGVAAVWVVIGSYLLRRV